VTASARPRSDASTTTTDTTACSSTSPAVTGISSSLSGGDHEPPVPHAETLLVLYLGDECAVAETCKRAATQPIEPANPYWRHHGVTLLDPDGFPVVLVPDAWP